MSNNRRSSITLVPIADIWVPIQPIVDEPGRPPGAFPENAIQILPDFFPDDLSDLVDGVIAGLEASTHVIRRQWRWRTPSVPSGRFEGPPARRCAGNPTSTTSRS